jgi:hypothetical protein
LIHPNGSIEVLPGPMPAMALSKLIGADIIDTVNLPNGMVMIVDDAGHQKKKPVNEIATRLYLNRCKPGTTHFIVGDVVIVPDADFADDDIQ